ncbi:MAG: 6-pyruvoyl-tetrahydropterin synthase, partial [Candidatus Binatia bacterium]
MRRGAKASTQGNSNLKGHYQVFVSKDNFKFNAAHFIAYQGFREKLHGHNYRVSVRV